MTAKLARAKRDWTGMRHGFYWTEGTRGLGWAADAVPTLKNGSTIGIPSPPAILMPTGVVIQPDIRDARVMLVWECQTADTDRAASYQSSLNLVL